MSSFAGMIKTTKRLRRAKARLQQLSDEVCVWHPSEPLTVFAQVEQYFQGVITRDLIELRNMLCVGQLIVQSALGRQESRGVH